MKETPAPNPTALGHEPNTPSLAGQTGQTSQTGLEQDTVAAPLDGIPLAGAADPEYTVGPQVESVGNADPSLAQPISHAEIATARNGSDATRRGLLSGTFDGKPGSPARFFKDYELLDELGRGGMGVVYKAKQIGLNRMVALKMILAGQLASETAVQRFYREAQSAASLDHPNIVPIYEIGEHENRHYFSMAYVEGQSLADSAKKNPMSLEQAVRIVKQVAESVHYAHEKGIVHRDLKPANILIDKQNRPRVTDFGLAKQIDDDSNLTATGHVMGTPCYMSPEQAKGISKEIGPASDIYSLGGILYRLLTGKPPFLGNSQTETLVKVLHEEVIPARQHNPAIPKALEDICNKCLAKKVEDRFHTAQELASALDEWLRNGDNSASFATIVAGTSESVSLSNPSASLPAAPKDGGKKSPWGFVALGIAAVAVIGSGAYFALPRTNGPSSAIAADPVSSSDVTPVPSVEGINVPAASRVDFKLNIQMVGSADGKGSSRVLEVGKPVKFDIQVAKDAYVGVWVVNADGSVMQLFPSEFETDNLVKAGEVRTVPGNANYDILSTPSTGPEYVRVIASTTPWDPIEGTRNGPYVVFESAKQKSELQGHLRGMVLKPKDDKTEVSEVVLPFQVSPSKAP
ncbi:MAG: serine/threonine-protein kinase [Planctomycetota bacterium]